MPGLEEKISIVGQVRWSRGREDHYDIGIEFIHREDDLSCELVSQVYYIDQYIVNEAQKGRKLEFEQAAEEWFSPCHLQDPVHFLSPRHDATLPADGRVQPNSVH